MAVKKAAVPGRRGRTWPAPNYYAELEPKQPDREPVHPIDDLLDASPDLRRKLAKVRNCERSVQPFLTDRKAFVKYADAQIDYRNSRQVEAFNLGVELGVVVGRTGLRKVSSAARASMSNDVLNAALSATTGPAGRLLSLFAIAEALLDGPADVAALKGAIEKFEARRHMPKKAKRR